MQVLNFDYNWLHFSQNLMHGKFVLQLHAAYSSPVHLIAIVQELINNYYVP